MKGAEPVRQEVADVTAFLHTLTGDQPQITRPLLPRVTEVTPRPQPMLRP